MPIRRFDHAFSGGPNYLNTANYGLLPNVAVDRLRDAARALGEGSFDTHVRDAALESARQSLARLLGVSGAHVATGCSASAFVGLVASSIPDGSTVLVAEEDFTSLTMPLVVQRDRLNVIAVAVDGVLDAIDDTVDVVAVSAVQSGDGTVMDLEALQHLRREHGVKVILDATQAAGWLPISADRYDVVIAAAYKWLLCPRGVAFAYFSRDMIQATRPILSGWYATDDIHAGYYGTDVELASSARRFDISPSGINWLGAEPALQLIAEHGVENIHRHNVAVANHFRNALGEPESDSAIVSLPIRAAAIERLRAHGITFGLQAGKRSGHARFAFHIYNTVSDATTAAACMR